EMSSPPATTAVAVAGAGVAVFAEAAAGVGEGLRPSGRAGVAGLAATWSAGTSGRSNAVGRSVDGRGVGGVAGSTRSTRGEATVAARTSRRLMSSRRNAEFPSQARWTVTVAAWQATAIFS